MLKSVHNLVNHKRYKARTSIGRIKQMTFTNKALTLLRGSISKAISKYKYYFDKRRKYRPLAHNMATLTQQNPCLVMHFNRTSKPVDITVEQVKLNDATKI